MEIKKSLFAKAFLITLALLLSLYSFNIYLNFEREKYLDERMNSVVDDFEEFQALSTLMNVFGENATCLTLNSQMRLMDTKIWALGEKIDNYRTISKDYINDPYYQQMKEKFNRQEVIYLSDLKEMRRRCGLSQLEILFFYRRGEDCPSCDDQAYVLNYFNQYIHPEIAVFSFDADLNMSSVGVLQGIYGITEYPCLVVGERVACGLQDKNALEIALCTESNNSISLCRK
jgi:hypothetical protein